MPDFTGISHIDLSVSDVEKSADWYVETLGLRRVRRSDLDNRIMVVLLHEPTCLVIGLNQHHEPSADRFDERRPGLDHIAFACADRAELESWAARLDELGVAHGGIKDAHYGSGVSFRDPDGIALEFFAPPAG